MAKVKAVCWQNTNLPLEVPLHRLSSVLRGGGTTTAPSTGRRCIASWDASTPICCAGSATNTGGCEHAGKPCTASELDGGDVTCDSAR